MESESKLTSSNYFSPESNMEYISNSQIKAFMECESRALAELKGEYVRPKSDALLQGSLLDVLLTGTKDEIKQFYKDHPDMVSSRGETKGQLKSNYKHIEEMADRVRKDAYFMECLNGVHQKIFTGELFGSKIKVKLDSYHDGTSIIDLKSCESLAKKFYNESEGRYVSFIEYWGYPMQGFIYQEIVRQNTGDRLPFFLACVSKEDEPDIGVIEIEQEELDAQYDILASEIPHIQAIKDGIIEPSRCEKCAYCRKTKVLSNAMSFKYEFKENA